MTTSTILQYNGVRIQNVQTLQFSETPINDSSGQYIYTKTQLRILGYMTLKNSKGIGFYPAFKDATDPDNPLGPASLDVEAGTSQQFAVLKHYLGQPRRRLIYSTLCTGSPDRPGNGNELGDEVGTTLFEIVPAIEALSINIEGTDQQNVINIHTDVKAGPTTSEISVTHVANNTVWRVEMTVEFHTVPPCIRRKEGYRVTLQEGDSILPEDSIDDQVTFPISTTISSVQRSLGVLSNRWSCKDMINDNGYTTRTYTGSLILANPNWNPQDYRCITTPPLAPGMKRMSIDYIASEDNLSLRYTIVDHEITISAPDPARSIRIIHNEAMVAFGAKGAFSIKVLLTGSANTAMYDLFLLSIAIIEQRILVGNPLNGVDAGIIIERREYTTEQGSDQGYALTAVWSGSRTTKDNKNIPAGQQLSDVASRSLTWKPIATPGILAGYRNKLSVGARQGEQPETEVGIEAITCLHAKLTQPCSPKFSFSASNTTSKELNDRKEFVRLLESETADYDAPNTSAFAEKYPTAITVSIDNNAKDWPTNLSFSDHHMTSMYSHYNITSEYGSDQMKVALPIARTSSYRSGAFNAIVKIGPKQNTRTIRVEAERVGAPPRLPFPIPSFTESKFGASASEVVTNTLINAKATHLNPAPVADGVSMIYTSYLELVYSQDGDVAKHRFCIPDYIKANPGTGEETTFNDATKYSQPIASIFIAGVLDNTAWNT